MPAVSVIIPTYNCAHYIAEAVDSVLSQTFGDIEIIIIDDGSTDETSGVLERYSGEGKLRCIIQRHAGLPASRNRGLEEATGEYIAFLDADDMFLPDKIERQVRAFQKHPGYDVIYSGWRYFYDGKKEETFPSTYARLSGDLLFFLKRSNFIHVSTVILRRVCLDSLRFDTSLESHEDWDFFLKLAFAGRRFLCLDEELAIVRVRRTSMTASRPTMDSSRVIVGERAKTMWKELKGGIGLSGKEGIGRLARYLTLRTRAALMGFPASPRFNKPLPFWR
ncbi:MAG: glycosyltransferase [Candidatus Omnitrophica bacterium]|nr:glycosyltransferase [Candidatus Omnitrophota bacterium]